MKNIMRSIAICSSLFASTGFARTPQDKLIELYQADKAYRCGDDMVIAVSSRLAEPINRFSPVELVAVAKFEYEVPAEIDLVKNDQFSSFLSGPQGEVLVVRNGSGYRDYQYAGGKAYVAKSITADKSRFKLYLKWAFKPLQYIATCDLI